MRKLVFALLCAVLSQQIFSQGLSEAETQAILRHGPWPPAWKPDPSNRVSGNPHAIELGERFFFEPRFSPSGQVLCATCHVPFRDWQDARPRALGLMEVERNTQSLFNLRTQRWFGWDGAGDSLWAQSVRPILDAREMGGSEARAAQLVRGDPDYACRYRKAFGAPIPESDEAVLAGIGKALAAFQETIVSGRSPFDEFRDALERADAVAIQRYPAAALRGLRTFVGKGNCSLCHVGPAFTNGEFHDVGVPFFSAVGVDPGRQGGIRKLLGNRLNLLGPHNDNANGSSAVRTRHVAPEHRNFGEFKVPGLRNVARTAPYMHNGSLATLADVVRHYSELSPDRIHSDGEAVLRPLRLSTAESADLVAFLDSLTEMKSALPEKRPSTPCP